MDTETMNAKLQVILNRMKPDYEETELDWEYSLEDLFQDVVKDTPEDLDESAYYECGSYQPTNTPCTLYRLLFLLSPKNPISFQRMYKEYILSFMSIDSRFIVAVHFYKFELGFYFYAQKDLVDTSRAKGVWSGSPSADNGQYLKNKEDSLFFDTVKQIMEYTHMVYSGNNFEV